MKVIKHPIPLERPTITKNDLVSVLNCLVDENISNQNLTTEFEKKFNQLVRARNNILALNHASSALYLIGKLIDLKPGDEVILSPLADYWVLEVLNLFKAVPVWIDLELNSFKMNPEMIKNKVGERTRMIMITHHFGYPFDMEELRKLDIDRNTPRESIVIVEDNSKLLGTKKVSEDGREEWLGFEGDFGIFSFAPHEILTTGLGGAVYSRTKSDHKKLRMMSSATQPLELIKDSSNENYLAKNRLELSMNDLNAALGLSELSFLEKFIVRRQEIRQYYIDVLMKTQHSFVNVDDMYKLNGLSFPVIFSSGIATAREIFDKFKIAVAGLENETIYQQIPYQEELTVINELKLKFLRIPIYPSLKVEEIDHISKVLSSIS